MPVNILNLPGLDVVDFRETDTEYHVRATPKAICLGRMTPEEPQYDVRNVVKEVTLGTDLSTLLAEIDD